MNQKIFFAQVLNFEMTDYDMINKYAIYKINQYITANMKDFNLWNSIQDNFKKLKVRHYDKFESNIQNFVRNYYYRHEYQIDHNFSLSKNQTTTMLNAVEVDKNNKLTLKQIK